jgi:hypothetical protein
VETRSFVVRFIVAGDGTTVARVTDASSMRQWLITESEALHVLRRALIKRPPTGERA